MRQFDILLNKAAGRLLLQCGRVRGEGWWLLQWRLLVVHAQLLFFDCFRLAWGRLGRRELLLAVLVLLLVRRLLAELLSR